MDKKCNVFYNEIRFPQPNNLLAFHNDTVLDGELVTTQTGPDAFQRIFFVFDLLAINGVCYTQRSFSSRLGLLQQDVIRPHKQLLQKSPELLAKMPFTIELRKHERAYGLGLTLDRIAAQRSPSTGVIFTPVRAPYTPGKSSKPVKLLRWLFPEYRTACFKVKSITDKDLKRHYQIMIADRSGAHKYFDEISLEPNVAQAWRSSSPDGRIIECTFDPAWKTFIWEHGYAGETRLANGDAPPGAPAKSEVPAHAAEEPEEEEEEEEEVIGGYAGVFSPETSAGNPVPMANAGDPPGTLPPHGHPYHPQYHQVAASLPQHGPGRPSPADACGTRKRNRDDSIDYALGVPHPRDRSSSVSSSNDQSGSDHATLPSQYYRHPHPYDGYQQQYPPEYAHPYATQHRRHHSLPQHDPHRDAPQHVEPSHPAEHHRYRTQEPHLHSAADAESGAPAVYEASGSNGGSNGGINGGNGSAAMPDYHQQYAPAAAHPATIQRRGSAVMGVGELQNSEDDEVGGPGSAPNEAVSHAPAPDSAPPMPPPLPPQADAPSGDSETQQESSSSSSHKRNWLAMILND
nr:Dcp1p-Dcp2p decapping enzyme complex alpha subunit [Polyrhizophydium stewartii]